MRLTKDQVRHVAKLANLPLTAKEEEKYSEQLSKILDYIEQLNQVDTLRLRSGQALEPTFNVTGLNNVERADEFQSELTQEEAILNANKKENSMFVTKGVFEE